MGIGKRGIDTKISSTKKDTQKKGFTNFKALNFLEDGIAFVDREWKYIFLNDASLTLKYKSKEEVIGHVMWDVHPELIGTPFETLLRNAMKSNEKAEAEEYFEPFDSWLHVKIFPSEEGLTLYYTNITEKKKAIAHRAFSEAVIHSSSDAIVTLDLNLKITSWNRGVEKMSGFTQEEVLGEPMDFRRNKDGKSEDREMAIRILNGSEQEAYFTERIKKSGELDQLSVVLTPIKDEHGKIAGVTFIGRNINKTKQAEKELQNSQRLYAFLSAINQSIVHIKSEAELFEKACSIAEEVGKYRMTWISVLDENGEFDRDQMFGNQEFIQRYLVFPKQDYTTFPLSGTPSGKVLATGKYAVANDVINDPAFELWKEELDSQNLRSLISLPVFKKGKMYGTFSLYSSEVGYFEEKELKLLLEATTDLSFGVDMIENEKIRLIAEDRVIQNTVILNQSQELALIGSFEVDFEKSKVVWSNELYRMFGYSPSEVEPTEELFISHLHPEDVEKMQSILADFNTNFKDATYEFRIITVAGEIKNIEANSRFIFDKKGNPKKVYGTNQDVTKRVEIEEKNKRNKLILDQSQLMSHVGSSEIDLETGVSIWSDEQFRVLGYKPDEVEPSAELYMSLVHPDDIEELNKSFLVDFNARKNSTAEYRIITKTGEIKHISGQIKFEFDQNGVATKMFGTTQDVTKKVEIDEKNKQGKLILDQSQQMAKIGSFEIDLVKNKRTWSDERFRMFGYSPGEIEPTEELYFSHIHPDDLDIMRADYDEFLKTFRDSSIEFRIITVSGEIKYMASKAKFEFDAKAKPIKIYGTTQDITERVQIDEKNKRSKIILDQSQQMAHVGSSEIDLETGTSIWSAEQFRILGYEPDEVEPGVELFLSHLHPEEAEERIQMFNDVFTAQIDTTNDYRIITKTGEVKHISGQVKFEFTEQGNAKKMFGTIQDITKIVQQDEITKQNKIILDQSQQMSHVGSTEIDLATGTSTWSAEQYRLLGYEPYEVEPSIELYLSHLHPDEAEERIKMFNNVFNARENNSDDYRIVTKSGEVKYISGQVKFEFDEKGIAKKMYGTTQDITKRVEFDETNKRNKFILDQSQEMARIGSLEVNLETNKTVWSDEQYRIFGYAPDEVEPSIELYISHLHPDDKVEKTKLFYEIFAKYQDTTQKYKIITKSGEVKYIFGHLKFEFDEKGKPKKMLGTVQDVTKRVEVEKKLKYSEAFSRAVIDSLSSHVGVMDKKGIIVATNDSWKEYGLTNQATIFPRAEVGVNLFEKCELNADLYGDYSKIAMREMKEIFSGQKTFFQMEYPCQIENEVHWFNLRIMNFDHKNEMIVVAHENITSLKLAQKERDNSLLVLEDRVYHRTKELHEMNTVFKDSINYAKRIQLGVLNSPIQLKEIFPKSFLFAKPCNILSGDFFWCLERNNLKYIVVADCTGHGVPAAFMSLVGNTLLNRIIKDVELIYDPAQILYQLDEKLLEALPGDDDRMVMDGMDLAICVVNSEENKVQFAGALRPLFVLNPDGTLIEFPGNRSSIGRGVDSQTKTFETKEFEYESGQTMYLTSDGYYSQFGGEKGKKLMKSAFKSILQELIVVPIEKQEKFMNNEFTKWQGDQPQVDDVLVVGIELE